MPNGVICQGMFRKIVAFLHARAKAALIQPSGLAGREPPQGNGDDLREPQGCEAPVQAVPAIVRFVPETTSVFSVGQSGWHSYPHAWNGRTTALGTQQRHQVGILRPRLFLRLEINKFSHPFFSVWIDVVPLAARGTLWYNFSP